jgi:hypothetical protein
MKIKLLALAMVAALAIFTAGTVQATDVTFGWDSYAEKADIAGGGFSLLYSQAQTGPWTRIATINDGNATSYKLTAIETVLAGSQYWFTLRAFRSGGTPESDNATPVLWNKPTTTTTSVQPTTTTTSIKPVVAPTGLTAR